jgi:glycosyltransferase involved in cell wall biosynthesis
MSAKPKISVLLPSYNSAAFLDDAITSVLEQTFTDFELIIVDNCSTDSTEKVVAKYLKDTRIKYYKNDSNIGMIPNWNKCLEYASGEFIKYLMSDDKFHLELLEKSARILEEHPTVSLVTCYKQVFKDNFECPLNIVELPFKNFQEGKKIIYHTLNTYGWIGEPTLVMFRSAHLSVGKFNDNYLFLSDWEMWLRLLNIGDCYIIPEPLAHIRAHSSQVTVTVMKNAINYFEAYEMSKSLKNDPTYHFDFSGINIDSIIKQRAKHLSKGMLRQIPRLHNAKNREIFRKAFRILYKEKVLLRSFTDLFVSVFSKG